MRILLGILLLTQISLASPEAEKREMDANLVNSLDQSGLQEAFRLIRKEYIKHDEVDYLEINRAALQGMLDRMGNGVMLLSEQSRSERNSPFHFHTQSVTKSIGLVRFGKFSLFELEKLDESLEGFNKDPRKRTLIVDLRSPQAQASFEIASQILSRFTRPNELLFKIRRPEEDGPHLFFSQPVDVSWRKEVILLVDEETGNIGEIIAATLKKQKDHLVIGSRTLGKTVEYRDVPIGEDRILRYAVAEVILSDNSSIFQTGIAPDIISPSHLDDKKKIYSALDRSEKDLSYFLFPQQRPRLNEAALVAGTDPELDYFLTLSQGKRTKWDQKITVDRTLQQAVDLVITRDFLNSKVNNGQWEDEENTITKQPSLFEEENADTTTTVPRGALK